MVISQVKVVSRSARLMAALGGLGLAVLLTVAGPGLPGQAAPESPPEDPAAKSQTPPTLKKTKTRETKPFVGGYLGYKDIVAELKITNEERARIAELQKWHAAEEDKLYAEYERRVREVLGDERWKQLAELVDKKREESATKKKKKTDTPPPGETQSEKTDP